MTRQDRCGKPRDHGVLLGKEVANDRLTSRRQAHFYRLRQRRYTNADRAQVTALPITMPNGCDPFGVGAATSNWSEGALRNPGCDVERMRRKRLAIERVGVDELPSGAARFPYSLRRSTCVEQQGDGRGTNPRPGKYRRKSTGCQVLGARPTAGAYRRLVPRNRTCPLLAGAGIYR